MTTMIDRRATLAMAIGATLMIEKAAGACTPNPPPPAGFSNDDMQAMRDLDAAFPRTPHARSLIDRMFAALAARDRSAFQAVISNDSDLSEDNRVSPLLDWFDRLGKPGSMFQLGPIKPKCEQVFFWGSLSARVEQDASNMCGPATAYLIYRFWFSNPSWRTEQAPSAYRIWRVTIL